MPAILAKKLGMTQLFREDGRVERVTVLEAGPCPVTAIRTFEIDGYEIDILVQGYPGKTVCHGGLGWSTIVLIRGRGRIALVDGHAEGFEFRRGH